MNIAGSCLQPKRQIDIMYGLPVLRRNVGMQNDAEFAFHLPVPGSRWRGPGVRLLKRISGAGKWCGKLAAAARA